MIALTVHPARQPGGLADVAGPQLSGTVRAIAVHQSRSRGAASGFTATAPAPSATA